MFAWNSHQKLCLLFPRCHFTIIQGRERIDDDILSKIECRISILMNKFIRIQFEYVSAWLGLIQLKSSVFLMVNCAEIQCAENVRNDGHFINWIVFLHWTENSLWCFTIHASIWAQTTIQLVFWMDTIRDSINSYHSTSTIYRMSNDQNAVMQYPAHKKCLSCTIFHWN